MAGKQPQFSAPQGTHDILPPAPGRDWADDVTKWHWLENEWRDLCRLYGYEEVRTPVFESTALFKRAVGEGTDIVAKETYDFHDRHTPPRQFTLRPEGTAPALRAYVQNRLYIERPVAKLYYVASIFRYEREQKGRYKQHHQFGVEALGSPGPEIDAEVIALASAFYQRIGVARLTLKINSVGSVESRARFVDALRSWATPLVGEMSEDNQRRFRENALRMLDSKSPRDQELLRDAPLLTDFLDDADRAHFETLQGYLADLGVSFEVDGRLVRGFDYYTRTAFEAQSPDVGSQSALGGGGRYDKLVEELGGPPTPGIGFGLGVERILIALQAAQVATPPAHGPVAFLCPLDAGARAAAVGLLARLRNAGVASDVDYTGRKLKAQLEFADRAGAAFAIVIGSDEVASGTVKVRDMATAEQETVAQADLAAHLLARGSVASVAG